MPNIEATLKTRIQNNEADSFVIIVPTDSARLNRQRELIDYHPNRAVANLQVYDIQNFIQRLYNRVRPARTHISTGIQNLWLNEIAEDDADNYNAFRPIQNKPIPDSTLSLIANTINNLKEKGETVRDIEANTPTKTDLSNIYSQYESKLQNGWIDDKGKHLYLANNFEDDFIKQAFPKANLIVVEGFFVLSKSDIKILTRIAQIPDIEMWFRTDCIEANTDLYKIIKSLVSQFRTAGAHIDTDYDRNDDNHSYFAQNLFQTNKTLTHKKDLTQQIKVIKPADRTDEVEQIAHLIQKHVSDGDCKLGDICVAYYNLTQYQQRIAETFPAFGIPYALVENIPLTKSEVVKAIFSRLSSRKEAIGDIYFSNDNPASPARAFLPNEFQDYINVILDKGGVLQRILNPMLQKNSKIVEGEVNALQTFKRIVGELCITLTSEEEGSFQLAYYINKLHYIAKHTHYQNRAQTKSETVKIVTLGELRSSEYKNVFLGDFVDGGFPPIYRPDPLLPDTPSRTEDEHLYDNRFLFYRVLKSFCERLYLLTPQRENVSQLIPSLFLSQLQEIAHIGSETIENPTQRSVPGFLSAYGNYVSTTEHSSTNTFPEDLDNRRSLIDHVVSIEKSREDTHELMAYEGRLKEGNLSEESQAQLEKLHEKRYSVSDLEIYANCPFQYYVNKVLRYKAEEDEEDDEPSPLEKGSLIHDVLFEFHNNRRENECPAIALCSDEDFDIAKQQLDEILHRKSEEKRNKREGVSEDNLFWIVEIEKQRVALHKWLDAQRKYDLTVMPRYFEVSVGYPLGNRDEELSQSEPVSIGNVKMVCKIDRLDIGAGSFNVIDYKTGSSTVRMQDILEGRSIQLPIYLQIAQQLLEQNGRTGLEPTAGLYHIIRLDECKVELGIGIEDYNDIAFRNYNGAEWKPVGTNSGQLLYDEQFESRLNRVSGYIQQYVESISNGIFPIITRVDSYVDSVEEGQAPLTPKDHTKPCSYCTYKRICRVGAFVESSQTDT